MQKNGKVKKISQTSEPKGKERKKWMKVETILCFVYFTTTTKKVEIRLIQQIYHSTN